MNLSSSYVNLLILNTLNSGHRKYCYIVYDRYLQQRAVQTVALLKDFISNEHFI